SRFRRDMERRHTEQAIPWKVSDKIEGKALVTTTSEITANNTIVLEEFSFEAQPNKQADTIAQWIAEHALPDLGARDYWSNKIKNSLVILPNDDFRDFALYATEIITRTRIDREKKTVERGALWTEEHLPSDSLLYVPIYATDARQNGKDGPKMTSSQVLERAR